MLSDAHQKRFLARKRGEFSIPIDSIRDFVVGPKNQYKRNVFDHLDSEEENSEDDDTQVIPTQTSTRPFTQEHEYEEVLSTSATSKSIHEQSFISAAKDISFNSISLSDIAPFRMASKRQSVASLENKQSSETLAEPAKTTAKRTFEEFIKSNLDMNSPVHDTTDTTLATKPPYEDFISSTSKAAKRLSVDAEKPLENSIEPSLEPSTLVNSNPLETSLEPSTLGEPEKETSEPLATTTKSPSESSIASATQRLSIDDSSQKLNDQSSVKSHQSQASLQDQVMDDFNEHTQELVHDPRFRTTIEDYHSSVASDIISIHQDNNSVQTATSVHKDNSSIYKASPSVHNDNISIHKDNSSIHKDVHNDYTKDKPLQASDFEGMQFDNDDIDMDPMYDDEPIYVDEAIVNTDTQDQDNPELQERIQEILEVSKKMSLPLKKAIRLGHLHISAIDKIAQETVRKSNIIHDAQSKEMIEKFYYGFRDDLQQCEAAYNRYQELNVTLKHVHGRYKKSNVQLLSVISEQGALERQIQQEKQQLEEAEKRIQEFSQFDDIFENIHLLKQS